MWCLGSLALTPVTAKALRSHGLVVFAMLMSFGFVILATLTPTAAALSGAGTSFEWCNLERLMLPAPSELFAINDTIRNVLLFIPLGLFLGLLARTRKAAILVVFAYLLPLA